MNGKIVCRMKRPWLAWLALFALVGCGTTRVTDTQRTATEQLVISNAVDQAVTQIDFRLLHGKQVFFDPQYLDGSVDRGYVVSSLRQHLLSAGAILVEDRTKATYVVEARSGGVGTDRHSLLFGVPQLTVPVVYPGMPSTIPEIPLAKTTDQKGYAKIAVFAYNRTTGRPVWQSGTVQAESSAKDTWVFGVGPLMQGSIREGTEFAGNQIALPLFGDEVEKEDRPAAVKVTAAAHFPEQPTALVVAPLTPLPPTPIKASEFGATRSPAPASVATKPAAPSSPTPPPPPSQPSMAGGQAETQPARVVVSGFDAKPAP